MYFVNPIMFFGKHQKMEWKKGFGKVYVVFFSGVTQPEDVAVDLKRWRGELKHSKMMYKNCLRKMLYYSNE